jgi:hypothetical protein
MEPAPILFHAGYPTADKADAVGKNIDGGDYFTKN